MADQLQEKVTVLAEEESLVSAILDSMADGVIITDDEGSVRLINPAAARLLGTARERALGRSFAQAVRQHQLIDLWHRCHELGEEQSIAVEVGRRGLFLQAIARPFSAADSEGYLVMLQDLTRVRRLETVRRDFISNISHELRTPLAGLKALADTLRGRAMKDPPAARRFLDRIEVEVDAMTQMVEELLELSRIESGQAPLHLEAIPAAECDRSTGREAATRLSGQACDSPSSRHPNPWCWQMLSGCRRWSPTWCTTQSSSRRQGGRDTDLGRGAWEEAVFSVKIQAWAYPPMTLPASLSVSTKPTALAPAVAPVWAWPSPSTSFKRTTGASGSRAWKGRGARFSSRCRQRTR